VTQPAIIQITSIAHLADRARLTGTGDPGVTYTIQATSDLIHWETIGTATTISSGTFEFEEAVATEAVARFYRVILQ